MARLFLLIFLLKYAARTYSECVFELGCRECVPENMPVVTSHTAREGVVRVAEGEGVALSCGAATFRAAPARAALAAVCERGRLRLQHDASLRHILDLGCEEDVYEDVLHTVEQCGAPLEGRAYQRRGAAGAGAGAGVRHVAAVCAAAGGGAVWARAGPAPLAPHAERSGPLSLLGNFNHMFDARTRLDAETLYSDDERLTRRVREMLKHDEFAFGDQRLAVGEVLAAAYFDDQDVRVADFASNKVAVWRSVAEGNLRHVQRDIGALMRSGRGAVEVFAGTHGVLAVGGRALYLRGGGRFPVARFVWSVVHDRRRGRALALVVLNEPLVAVSEVRAAVFCESACGRAEWARSLTRQRRYERAALGLTFCCSLRDFARAVPEMPLALLPNVTAGPEGMLLQPYD